MFFTGIRVGVDPEPLLPLPEQLESERYGPSSNNISKAGAWKRLSSGSIA